LRRTQAGAFTLAQAIGLEELKALAGDPRAIEQRLPHPRMLLPEMPSVTVDELTAGGCAMDAGESAGVFGGGMVKVLPVDGVAGSREADCGDADAADCGAGVRRATPTTSE